LVTPPLNGSILPGVTRDAVLTLATRLGYQVEERPYGIDEWHADAAGGSLREVFACGTGVVITAIGTARDADGEFTVNGGAEGSVTRSIRAALLDIQHGRAADEFGWLRRLDDR
jgi:branched-chain amino acid aminotransferase